ncbi:MAG TPA: divergent polysaccharide deacetylase family protein [Spirochaetales bacterium]|nr:divergent polysaccharide deacetylase family protein [Spirochaetales bacterium]HPG86479.1 divergent polysaccharide deacetylase family protein [Spirochaetales bacterium]HPM73446.1 divergent polysaccharide deacetylase family protein [Spirochaetales bacterium]
MPTKRPRKSPRDRGASILLYTSATLVLMSFALAIALSSAGSRPDRDARLPKADERQETAAPPAPSEAVPKGDGGAAGPAMTDTGPTVAPQRPQPVERPAPRSRGVLVFVIDDAGHNRWQLEPFLKLPGPITIAVLPGLPHTANAASMVKAAGKELILHQPMEALGGLDPGPGAIRADMDDGTIRDIIRGNLAQVPGARGVNNHMGSKATSDVRVMSTVLDETSANGLYFLDSLTTGDSVVHSVASLMRQSAWERSVFLDNTPDKASILNYIAEGTKIAEKRGYAVMIGHVWSSELAQTLADLYPQLLEQGFSLSTISRIMMDDDDDDDTGY